GIGCACEGDHLVLMKKKGEGGQFDESSWQLLAILGLTAERFSNEGFGMAAIGQGIQHKHGLRRGDLITVGAGVLDVGKSALRLGHEMRHDTSGELSAAMTAVGVCLDSASRKSRPLPEDVRRSALFHTYSDDNANHGASLVEQGDIPSNRKLSNL